MEQIKDFKYQIAFSFHSLDEGKATQLNDLLTDRFSTFIYTERQKELAGTDGELTFNAVYGGEARVVVVFYRPEWGQTPFTRIEMTAIRNRAFNEGFGFTLFIPTCIPPSNPPWLPKTQIYYDIARFGMEGAAAVVAHKVTSEGGTSRPETAIERAARFSRAAELSQAQANFKYAGTVAASEAFQKFSTHLQSLAEGIANTPNLTIRWQEHRAFRVLGGPRINSIIEWDLAYANTLENAALRATYYLGMPSGVLPGIYSWDEPKRLSRSNFTFELIALGEMAYVGTDNGQRRTFTPEQLADHLLQEYLDVVEQDANRRGR